MIACCFAHDLGLGDTREFVFGLDAPAGSLEFDTA